MSRSIPGIRSLAFVALVCLAGSTAQASSPPTLRFDPFREREKAPVVRPAPRASSDQRTFEPVMISTVVGGQRSVANLGGELLEPGEASHGYRLLEVRTFEAVFVKDGKRVVLEVVGRQEESR